MGNGNGLKNLFSHDTSTGISRRRFIHLLGTAGALAGFGPLAGCGASRRRAKRPIDTRFDTIAHEMLDIEQEHVISPEAYEQLEYLITVSEETLKSLAPAQPGDRHAALVSLETIAKVIDAFGFTYQKNGLLANALKSRHIDCDGYSVIYLAVGEIMDLPITMVRAPAHTFVRWQLSDDEYINWETTISAEKPDEYYIRKHDIARASNGISAMRSLDVHRDREKILANAYVNCGVEWLKKMRLNEAIERFNAAIERDPFYEAPYYNIGLVYYHQGDMARAITWCKKALSLNPNHMKSHAVLGTAYMVINDKERAKKHFQRVKELDPDYYATKIIEMRLTTSRN